MILFQYYKIPSLFRNLFSQTESVVNDSYGIINSNRIEIHRSFLVELYGRNYTEEQMNYNLDEIKKLILSLERLDWEKIGKIYFIVFFIISILLFNLLYPLEVNSI